LKELSHNINNFKDTKTSTNRFAPSIEEYIQGLNNDYLEPPKNLANEWLSKLFVSPLSNLDDLAAQCASVPEISQPSIWKFIRRGIEGRIVGYEEATIPRTQMGANLSLTRPINSTDTRSYVKGKAGALPFAPGGLSTSTSSSGKTAIFDVLPGFTRGIKFDETAPDDDLSAIDEIDQTGSIFESQESEEYITQRILTDTGPQEELAKPALSQTNFLDLSEIEEIINSADSSALTIAGYSKAETNEHKWAHEVDVSHPITNFTELVPVPARQWPFELDTFQKEAIYHLEQGDSVLVAAHTSAGKTVVAEYAIALAQRNMTKAIYTSPIKALSNQKFRDFTESFNGDVGIFTGDVQIKPDANCLIMTTEILRSMLYRGADIVRDIEFVIFDEVHYVNDAERGMVWEEVIIMLPEHVKLILLSATVPNTMEFASWVGATKKRDIYVISTSHRPVPLEIYLWAQNDIHKIVNAKKKFLQQGYAEAEGKLMKSGGSSANAGRGGREGGRGRGGGRRGNSNLRNSAPSAQFSKNSWIDVVRYLEKSNLFPAVVFMFSRKKCEQVAGYFSGFNFCTKSEQAVIRRYVDQSLARLRVEDRDLPQISRMTDLLLRGIAVHHSGLLPILKEIVEILFAKSFLRLLFATETFAVGLNLPARTVLFSEISKFNGKINRNLLPGEFIQMSGRAGRRGLDASGTVIILSSKNKLPSSAALKSLALGPVTRLQSQFRLTYNMMLNLLRVEALKVEDMLKRSYSENASMQQTPMQLKSLRNSEQVLEKLQNDKAKSWKWYKSMKMFHDSAMEYASDYSKLIALAVRDSSFVKGFNPGRIIVFHTDKGRTVGMIQRSTFRRLVDGVDIKFVVAAREPTSDAGDIFAFHGSNRRFGLHKYISLPSGTMKKQFTIRPYDIECVTFMRVDITGSVEDAIKKADELVNESNLIRKIEGLSNTLWKYPSVNDKNALGVYQVIHEEYLVRQSIEDLKRALSSQNLELLPEYEQRLAVLRELRLIDENDNVELKGRVACEINTGNELLLTELIMDNFFESLTPPEVAALLSTFVCEVRSNSVVGNISPAIDYGRAKIVKTADEISKIQAKHRVVASENESNWHEDERFCLMEVAYEWASGMPFKEIIKLTDILEGNIVRVITRLDEVCREVKTAARTIGNASLMVKMQETQDLIKRDIVFCASLYM
ncbi:hypothetical protein CANCADRAFT_16251, partial [Tortispora caseinolytica NRRL Y-17796]